MKSNRLSVPVLALVLFVSPIAPSAGTNDPSLHAQYVARAQAEIIETLFVGDSITKAWPTSSAWALYSYDLAPAAFGISGDETGQVLWRLQNGEMPAHQPKRFVVLSGVPDLYHGRTPQEVAEGVVAIAEYIRASAPGSFVLVLGTTPFLSAAYSVSAAQSNALVRASIEGRCSTNLVFRDVSQIFLRGGSPNPDLFLDLIHPNDLGYQRLSVELLPLLWAVR